MSKGGLRAPAAGAEAAHGSGAGRMAGVKARSAAMRIDPWTGWPATCQQWAFWVRAAVQCGCRMLAGFGGVLGVHFDGMSGKVRSAYPTFECCRLYGNLRTTAKSKTEFIRFGRDLIRAFYKGCGPRLGSRHDRKTGSRPVFHEGIVGGLL